MNELRTPGVYVEEINAFPNSVVQAQTGIPLFVGYTKKAETPSGDPLGKPQRITSMMDFERFFGGAPSVKVTFDGGFKLGDDRFYLYRAVQMFFANGGGTAWIESVGSYDDDVDANALSAVFEAGSNAELEREPDVVVIPDVMRLTDVSAAAGVYNAALVSSDRLQDARLVVMDVLGGDQALNSDLEPVNGFREAVTGPASYGAIYYPWVHTNLVSRVGLDVCDDAAVNELKAAIDKDFGEAQMGTDLKAAIDEDPETGHAAAMAQSPTYAAKMQKVLEVINLQPVAGAIAGVYARVDNTIGVFKAPANTGVISVLSPAAAISDDQQGELNKPLNGRAVNAIRSFVGRGVLVWGARTLDGNSQDWRYVNVRRTLLMFERSVRAACEPYVFAPNTAPTWVTIKAMIENFLNNQWKAGALAGATPKEAYDVRIGLGETMTATDILDGVLNVEIAVAVVRPAEFIVLKFQQKLQTS